MYKITIIAAIIFLGLFFILSSYAECALVGKVSSAQGRSDVLKAGTKTLHPVKAGIPVDIGDIFRVKSDGKVEITFFDGGILRIGAASRVEIKDYSSDAQKTNNIIRLATGHVQVITGKTFIQKISRLTEGNKFEVHTPNATAGVRGSNMVVSFIRSVTTTLFIDGKGYQYNPADPSGTRITIVKGEISFVHAPLAPPTSPRKASPSETTQIINTVTPSGREGNTGKGTPPSETSGTPANTLSTTSGSAGAASSSGSGTSGTSEPMSSFLAGATLSSISLTDPTTPTIATDYLITAPTLGTGTATTLPVIPVTEDTQVVSALSALTAPAQPGFSASFSGQLFKMYWGTAGKGYSNGAGGMYDYNYIKTSTTRLGTGETGLETYGNEIVINGNGSSSMLSFPVFSSGIMYYPDGTYVTYSQTPTTSIATGLWGLPFDVGSLSGSGNVTQYPYATGNTLELSGSSTGTIMSSQLSWNAPFPFSIGGNLYPIDATSTPHEFRAQMTGLTTDGGAYSIFGGGIISSYTNRALGSLYGIAIDPANRGLVWSGSYTGSYDPAGATWASSGTMTPIVMNASLAMPASSLSSNLDYGFIQGSMWSSFPGAIGGFGDENGWGQTLSIRGQPWGVYQTIFGIYSSYYNPSSATSFQSVFSGWGEFGSHQMNSGVWRKNTGFYIANTPNGLNTPITPGSGKTTGMVTGTFWTYTGMGTISGTVLGAYVNNTHYGNTSGYWQKTQDFSFAGAIDRAGGRRLTAWTEGSYSYVDGTFSYRYANDAQIGMTTYSNTATQQMVTRSYKPSLYSDYSAYAQRDWQYNQEIGQNVMTAYYTGEYAMDISNIRYLAPPGYISSVGPSSNYSFYYGGGTPEGSTGIMGGSGNLWAATAASPVPIYFGGEYGTSYPTDRLPYLYVAKIASYNPYLDNGTTAIGGAYSGTITAIIDQASGNVESGRISLLSINNGMAGIIRGGFFGSANSYAGSWQGTGTMYPVDIMPTSIAPENLSANIRTLIYQLASPNSTITTTNSGFWNGSSWSGSISTTNVDLRSIWINSMGWGITRTMLGGTYSGTPENTWRSVFEWENTTGGGGTYELIGRGLSGSTWSGNRFYGSMGGYRGWISATDAGVNISFSNLAGTFNPSVTTWQAVGTGMWMNLNQFFALQGTASGQETLQKLNIPCVEVGSINMTGSGNGFSSLTLNNTKFFSNAGGGVPMLWATNNITGSYTSIPATAGATTVSGGGVGATIVMRHWDATNNKWLAAVDGSGTLSGSYTGSVVIKGAAAGGISPTSGSTGNVTGVAGGMARK